MAAVVAEQEQSVIQEVVDCPEVLEPTPSEAPSMLESVNGWDTWAQCREGHELKYIQGGAGACDGCGRHVKGGEMVMDCRQCNFYRCRVCTPVDTCPTGHKLRTSAALTGNCAGCQVSLKQGEMVMDCRKCNWYVCSKCHPITRCPAHHTLKLWATQSEGACDKCSKTVEKTEMVMDCRHCNWYLCNSCHPREKGAQMGCSIQAAGCTPLPQCPTGHSLRPIAAKEGKCDKCDKKLMPNEMVMDCRQCDYYLCTTCHPITQCPVGHQLQPTSAASGACDGCKKVVQKNQMVMDCRQCNWYLCAACHLPRKAAVAEVGGC